jgi:acetate---CoA ligase (ADP-forming)
MAAPSRARSRDLETFFAPRSLAVVGASDDPTKIGGRPIKFLREMSFRGAIFPVNPQRDRIQGLPCFRSIDSIPGPFDHAILAVPAEQVLPALEACAGKGARDATIFTSGFAEVGDPGRNRQRELDALRTRLGLRILGPNCQGFANVPRAVYATFSSGLDRAAPAPGPLAVISQSGVLSAVVYVLLRQAGVGVSQWINTGNEVDIDAADALWYSAHRPEVSTIALALETVRSGDAFAEAALEARALGKRVFLVKGGRTDVGAAASLSHTGAILGRDEAYDALFHQVGAVRLRTLRELVDAAVLSASFTPPAPSHSRARSSGAPRLGIITNSGGASILAADAAVSRGMRVPQASPDLARALARALPEYAVPQNPLDLTGYYVSHPEALDQTAELFARSGEFDALLIYLGIIGQLYQLERIVETFDKLASAAPVPVILVWQAGDETVGRQIAATGVPVFDDVDRAIAALPALFDAAGPADRGGPLHGTISHRAHPGPDDRARAAARSVVAAARRAGRALSPTEMRGVLDAYGIPGAGGVVCRTPEEAMAAVAALGTPVVLKIDSPDIAHKTEAGGVKVGIATPEGAGAAFREIIASVGSRRQGARIDGVRVEPMRSGVEMIIGMLTDPALGIFVTLGLGGVLVELIRDVVMRRLPLAPGEPARMLADLRGRALLEGFRAAAPADVAAVIDVLERWSALAWELAADLSEAEINPLIVGPEGTGAVAVDVMMTLRREEA